MAPSLAQPAQPTGSRAPASTVTVAAEAGFNGYIKPGAWIPVRVTLSSNEAIDGEIVLSPQPDRSRRYGAAVSLARNVRKQITLYSPPTSNPVEVLFINNGKVVAASIPALRPLAEGDRMIMVVSDPPDGMNFLSDLRTPFGGKSFIAQLTQEDMPERTAALDTADVLVLNNVDTLSFSEAQRGAVRTWVIGGGHLIISGGPGAKLAAAGFTDFAPARVGASLESSSVANLRELLAPNSVDAGGTISAATSVSPSVANAAGMRAPVAVLEPANDDARTLVSSDDTPLIIRREVGRGIVDQLAFDPSLAPLRDWPDRRLIFAGLLGGRIGIPEIIGPLRADYGAVNAARALPGAALPPFLVVAGFLMLYVLTIGPINFFLLRKVNRLTWAWFTVPGTVVLFALLGSATGFRLRGNEPQVHRLSIITGDASVEDGRAQSIVGLFSPRRVSLDVSTGSSLAVEIQPNPNVQEQLDFILSEPNRLEKVVATNNDVRAFYLRGEARLSRIESDLSFIPGQTISEPARVAGEIRNESGANLIDCVLIAGKDYRVIGNIAPNAHVQAEVKLLLNRPQMRATMPPARSASSSYASSLGTSIGRSAMSSAALQSYRSPFDMDGASLAEILLNWRDFRQDRLAEQSERGLLTSILDSPDASAGGGVSLGCWEDSDRVGAQVTGGSYTDRGLRLWRLAVKPFLAERGTLLPPDVFGWDVVSSSSSVDLVQTGLDLQPGQHIIALSPWLRTRATGSVEMALTVGTSVNSPVTALRDSSVWLFDWAARQFTRVITDVSTANAQVDVSGAYLSSSGEIRVRIDVQDDQITLTNIQASARIP